MQMLYNNCTPLFSKSVPIRKTATKYQPLCNGKREKSFCYSQPQKWHNNYMLYALGDHHLFPSSDIRFLNQELTLVREFIVLFSLFVVDLIKTFLISKHMRLSTIMHFQSHKSAFRTKIKIFWSVVNFQP